MEHRHAPSDFAVSNRRHVFAYRFSPALPGDVVLPSKLGLGHHPDSTLAEACNDDSLAHRVRQYADSLLNRLDPIPESFLKPHGKRIAQPGWPAQVTPEGLRRLNRQPLIRDWGF